jgi:type IV pilus assembly protein PilZ
MASKTIACRAEWSKSAERRGFWAWTPTGGGSRAFVVSDEQPKPSERPPLSDRRGSDRVEVTWAVDCESRDTFLYASIANISEFGIFVRTQEPLEVGTRLRLTFAAPGSEEPFILHGQVAWVNAVRMLADNPNPGMGVRFVDLTADARTRLIETVRTIAYVRENVN